MNVNMNVNTSSNKIDMFIITTGKKYLPDDKLLLVRDRLERINPNKLAALQSLNYKSPFKILLFSIILGFWGVDRFIFDQKWLGTFKFFTIGGYGIWWILDWFTAMNRAREWNFNMLMNYI